MIITAERPRIQSENSSAIFRGLPFELPAHLEAGEPPEIRGLCRDEVRLMVSSMHSNAIEHARFRELPDYLQPGDVLIINTSGTLNAALPATRSGAANYELHLSTRLPDGNWVVEMRYGHGHTSEPVFDLRIGESIELPAGGTLNVKEPYALNHSSATSSFRQRLWVASLHTPIYWQTYLQRHGFPIRYTYVKEEWPLDYYQTVYATEPGSAEMVSAGRAFSERLITKLIARGVIIVPLLLHTGVASLEIHEPPYEEYYRVPAETARQVNLARQLGNRRIAVGTTVVRALETVTGIDGQVTAGEGWTREIITPKRGIQAVDSILTGMHEPKATHLDMLAALAGYRHLEIAYREALQHGYLWHEFGDLHLMVP